MGTDNKLKMWWDINTLDLYMEVVVPIGAWFSIGFGKDMTDTDMIVWHAFDTNPYAEDYKSFSRGKPDVDPTNNLVTSYEKSADGNSIIF